MYTFHPNPPISDLRICRSLLYRIFRRPGSLSFVHLRYYLSIIRSVQCSAFFTSGIIYPIPRLPINTYNIYLVHLIYTTCLLECIVTLVPPLSSSHWRSCFIWRVDYHTTGKFGISEFRCSLYTTLNSQIVNRIKILLK